MAIISRCVGNWIPADPTTMLQHRLIVARKARIPSRAALPPPPDRTHRSPNSYVSPKLVGDIGPVGKEKRMLSNLSAANSGDSGEFCRHGASPWGLY